MRTITRKNKKNTRKNTRKNTAICNLLNTTSMIGSNEDIYTFGVCSKKHKKGKRTMRHKGGWKTPGPLVGVPYAFPNHLPGETGDGGSNYYTLNKLSHGDLQPGMLRNSNSGGGYIRKRRRNIKHKTKRKQGGGLFQQLANAGRNVMYDVGSLSNTYRGVNPPVNPNPLYDQMPKTNF